MGIFSFVKPGKKIFQTIKSVKPNVPTTKKQKLLSKLKKTTQTVKGATAKLKQTQFERANPQFKGKDFTFATTTKKTPKVSELKAKKEDDAIAKEFGVRFKKAKGGRIGLKQGTNPFKKETNIEKIKKTFAPKGKVKFDAKKSDLDKSGSLSPYEKRRGMAIAKAMAKRKKKV